MTKRESKIKALNMVGNMHLWCSEFIQGEEKEKELVLKEVDKICEQLRYRAYKLENKPKNKK